MEDENPKDGPEEPVDADGTKLSGNKFDFAKAEHQALRTEIDYLSRRSETAQYTAILANAAVLSLVFLGAAINVAGGGAAPNPELAEKLSLQILVILLAFNFVLGLRTVLLEMHVDKIGLYICRIEDAVYPICETDVEAADSRLGWENYQRPGVKGSWSELFRRWGIWLLLLIITCVAIGYKWQA